MSPDLASAFKLHAALLQLHALEDGIFAEAAADVKDGPLAPLFPRGVGGLRFGRRAAEEIELLEDAPRRSLRCVQCGGKARRAAIK